MKRFIFFTILCVGLFQSACDTDNEVALEVPDRIVDKSLVLFEGSVSEQRAEENDNVPVWVVKILKTSGSVVVFYWKRDNEDLHRMDGEAGPYDYDIILGGGMVNFNSAKFAAIGAAKSDELVKWLLREEDDYADQWVYTFDIIDNGQNIKVIVDARNGDVLEIE